MPLSSCKVFSDEFTAEIKKMINHLHQHGLSHEKVAEIMQKKLEQPLNELNEELGCSIAALLGCCLLIDNQVQVVNEITLLEHLEKGGSNASEN